MLLKKSKKAFTLLEILIVMVIIGILTSFSFIYLGHTEKTVRLDTAVKDVVNNLQIARLRSMSLEDGAQWGVKLDRDEKGDYFFIFSDKGHQESRNYLPKNIKFNDVLLGKTIEFEKLTGNHFLTTIIEIISQETSRSKFIVINSEGRIECIENFISLVRILDIVPQNYDYFEKILIDSDYVYAVGTAMVSSTGRRIDGVIAKFKKYDLSLENIKLWGANNDQAFFDAVLDSNYIYVVGYGGPMGETDAALVVFNKTDLSTVAQKVYGSTDYDYFRKIFVDSNYIYLVGKTKSEGSGRFDALLVKLNKENLSLAGRKIYGGSGNEEFVSIFVDSDYIWLAGSTDSEGAGKNDGLLLKLNKSDLSFLGAKIYGTSEDENFSIYNIDSNFIYIRGYTTYYGNRDILLLKINKENLSLSEVKIWGKKEYYDTLSGEYTSGYGYFGGATQSEKVGEETSSALLLKFNLQTFSFEFQKIYGMKEIERKTSFISPSFIAGESYLYVGGHVEFQQVENRNCIIGKFLNQPPSGTFYSFPPKFVYKDINLPLDNFTISSQNPSSLVLQNSNLNWQDWNEGNLLVPENYTFSDLYIIFP